MRKYAITLLLALFAINVVAQIEVVNIENRAVQAYMKDSTYYHDSNCNNTVITKYSNNSVYGNDLDLPQGKTVTWTTSTAPSEVKETRIVIYAGKFDYQVFYPAKATDRSYVIRNLLPNLTYNYIVEEELHDGTVNELTYGEFETIGQVRMIQVSGSRNVRDIGGWPSSLGGPLKYGWLYRSANLDRVTAKGKHDFCENLFVGAELDLRAESKRKTSPLGDDKDYLVLAHSSYNTGMKTKSYVYVDDFKFIAKNLREGKSVDWHCAIGCDRCGTVSFLVEGVLGVGDIDLCRDYELSTFSKQERTRKYVGSMIKFIQGYGPKDDLAQCFYNYLIGIGVAKDDIEFIREMMIPGYVRE